jgi:S1-C subfamily serine protease
MDSMRRGPSRAFFSILLAFLVGAGASALAVRFSTGKWPGVASRAPDRPPAEPRPIVARGDLAQDEQATIALFRQASPGVVYITTLAHRAVGFFDVMEVPQGTGSGFVWDDKGHVVTNFHVIQGVSAARVTLHDQSEWPAELVGVAPDQDLAVLRIRAPAQKLSPILVGTSRDLQVGQRVLAIGNPFGLDFTLTTGIVSALGRSIPALTGRKIQDVIQTDAAINPGNSGGPLLDSAGRLIGVNTQIASPSGASAGIGFAVPVDTVTRVVPELIQHGKLVRPQIGVLLANERILRSASVEGVLVLQVAPGSPAAKAGIRGTSRGEDGSLILGDIIQGFGGHKIASQDDLSSALDLQKIGDKVRITLLRDGKTRDVHVTLEASQ